MSLTTVERLVLESLGQKPRSQQELQLDTRLQPKYLSKIVRALTVRGFIVSGTEGLRLNPRLPEGERREISTFDSKREEVLELASGMLSPHNSPLRTHKVCMSERDRVMLRGILKNLEDFVVGLPAPKSSDPTHAWSVVVWGEEGYGTIVQRLLGETL